MTRLFVDSIINMKLKQLILFFAMLIAKIAITQTSVYTDVLVIGGGTGGTAAGIQSARMGVKTVIAEEGPWLGGMLSAAGVSATDGNHDLPSGIWNEFRNEIYKVYGGPQKVATGWVSNTQFEPRIADSIFKSMAMKEKKLTVYFHYRFLSVIKKNNKLMGAHFMDTQTGKKIIVFAKQVIEATELGDVIASAKIPYSLGMESGAITGEDVGVAQSNSIIQDLTFVAILKDFGQGADKTIPKPEGYHPEEFDGACTDYYNDKTRKAPSVDAQKMLDYAKLPNGKYILNWPGYGNDIYLDIIQLTPQQRIMELEKAKQQTLRFVYFIQTQLGYKNLGLADDEFPTKDKLALIPYYRESRRGKGVTRFTINHIAKPFEYNYYRTGISVGDYPIDHHHKKKPNAPQHLDFYPVPSFNIPLGSLIPEKMDGLILCDKSISVSNVVNGATRLQPCVLLTGQAAGVLAALSVVQNKQPRNISVREVQKNLLSAGACIMPYIDVPFTHRYFIAIQKIGATGILKGTGIPYKWANQTWFYPDSVMEVEIFARDAENCTGIKFNSENKIVIVNDIIQYISNIYKNGGKTILSEENITKNWASLGLENFDTKRPAKRFEIAVLLNAWINPFDTIAVDHNGNFKK
jgi:hypothetical protein